MDSQITELLGRNRLVSELLRAGLEVALPARDRGIDLIAYVDLERDASAFIARPIQMKAASSASFSIDRKYERIRNLLIAFVWQLERQDAAVTYALGYAEAVRVGDSMGYTKTASWTGANAYSTTRPSAKLIQLLEPHRMTSERWWTLVVGTPPNKSLERSRDR